MPWMGNEAESWAFSRKYGVGWFLCWCCKGEPLVLLLHYGFLPFLSRISFIFALFGFIFFWFGLLSIFPHFSTFPLFLVFPFLFSQNEIFSVKREYLSCPLHSGRNFPS
jgi:hypothetical protein